MEPVAPDWTSRLDSARARRERLPPVHFSTDDPWREYRLALHYKYGDQSLTQLPQSTDLTINTSVADPAVGTTCLALNRNGKATKLTIYKGVVWDRLSRSWRAKMKVKGKTWYLCVHFQNAACGLSH